MAADNNGYDYTKRLSLYLEKNFCFQMYTTNILLKFFDLKKRYDDNYYTVSFRDLDLK